MQSNLLYIKKILVFELIVGVLLTIFINFLMMFFLADNPYSSTSSYLLNLLLTFIVSSAIFCFMPYRALQGLKKNPVELKPLYFQMISGVVLIVPPLIPLGLILSIVKLYYLKNKSKQNPS